MTTATTSRTNAPGARLSYRELSSTQLLVGAILISAGLSALSLVFNHAIDYDPEGWIVYAREALGPLALDTNGFPAWKPLPVILIAPFTLITRGEADVYYWLFITRACSVLTVFSVAALAGRFGGRWAALLAAAMVVFAPYWAVDGAIGRDSALSPLFFSCAFLAHYRGWFKWTVVALVAVSLLRPEATPFLIIYGAWMWRTGRMSWWLPLLAVALIIFLWFIPTIFHSGKSPASISLDSGGTNSPTHSRYPALAAIKDAAEQAHEIPAILLAITMLAVAYRVVLRRKDFIADLWGRNSEELVLLATATVWVLGVAAETQKGYAGNPRYMVPAIVLCFAIGSVVTVRLARNSRAALAVGLTVCVVGTGVLAIHAMRSGVQLIQGRDDQIHAIRQELAMVKCPPGTRHEANHANNAYLAQITDQPLQDTINWNLPNTYFRGSYYWFVYCSP